MKKRNWYEKGATPIALYFMDMVLNEFAYNVTLGPMIFVQDYDDYRYATGSFQALHGFCYESSNFAKVRRIGLHDLMFDHKPVHAPYTNIITKIFFNAHFSQSMLIVK